MALNKRQEEFLKKLKFISARGVEFHSACFDLYQSYNEEFKNSHDNTFVGEETALEEEYNITIDAIAKFANQFCGAFNGFYTNSAVTTREYGKFARRVAGETRIMRG